MAVKAPEKVLAAVNEAPPKAVNAAAAVVAPVPPRAMDNCPAHASVKACDAIEPVIFASFVID